MDVLGNYILDRFLQKVEAEYRQLLVLPMVPILIGNSEIGAHVRSDLGYQICLRHLFGSRVVTNRIFFLRNALFFFVAYMNYHQV